MGSEMCIRDRSHDGATILHWTSSLANLSLYRRPTFVHVHVPELAYTQDWVHPSLQLNPSAAGDDRYYQHYPCCAGRLVAKEQWVTAGCWTLMGPPRDRVAKSIRCTNPPLDHVRNEIRL